MRKWFAALALAAMIAGCNGAEQKPEPEPAPAAPAPAPAPAPAEPDAWTLPEGANPALLDPSLSTEQAPAEYKVKFETTKGDFVVLVHRDWAPNGADRFYNLVKMGFYDQCKFFRVINGFMAQFGISGYPAVSEKWKEASIPDDPVKEKNLTGRLSFATRGPNTRTTQLFINLVDNSGSLDSRGFAPFAEVVEGIEVVKALHDGYGEGAPRGRGPDQGRIQERGNAYLEKQFDKLDAIKKASVQ
ncbi:MAG: peptidylprolyl isomerase [Myxococcota bacterium]